MATTNDEDGDMANNNDDASTTIDFFIIPQDVQVVIFSYLPSLPYYFSLRTLSKFFAFRLSFLLSKMTCLNISSHEPQKVVWSHSPSLLESKLDHKCLKNIKTLVLSSSSILHVERLLGRYHNLKELTYPKDIRCSPPWINHIPHLNADLVSALTRVTRHNPGQLVKINLFLRPTSAEMFPGNYSHDRHYVEVGSSDSEDSDSSSDETEDGEDKKGCKKVLSKERRIERGKLMHTLTDVLRYFPKLKQLNVYNSKLRDRDAVKCLEDIQLLTRTKQEIVEKLESGNYQEARDMIVDVPAYNRLLCHPPTISEDFELNVYPCWYQSKKELAFDDLIRCGLSPKTVVLDGRRSYLYMVLHFGKWNVRKRYLEKLYNKYPNEFFFWFEEKDWKLLLTKTCRNDEFIKFFLPKFTKCEFLRVLSPSILAHVGDKAYSVIEQMPNFGFDFKCIPNLLTSVEKAPLLYQLFCNHDCSLNSQETIIYDSLKPEIGPWVLRKMLQGTGDLSNDKEFLDRVFNLLDADDEQLALLALDKIGSENVRSYLNDEGNTYLHAVLKKGRLEIARVIISRYGVNVNQMNLKEETILHIACHSIRCIPSMIQLLLDLPGIKTYLKNRDGLFAYDIMLKTLSTNGYSSSVYSNILQRLAPEEAVQVGQMIAKVNKERNSRDDPDFTGPRKKKAAVPSSYKRKRAKGTKDSNEYENDSEKEQEDTNCMSLRSNRRKFSEYP